MKNVIYTLVSRVLKYYDGEYVPRVERVMIRLEAESKRVSAVIGLLKASPPMLLCSIHHPIGPKSA